jgi:ferric-dicitrate binding protein FerR (iron transport regulator)
MMNPELQQKLNAYLDNALGAAERAEVEATLSRMPEAREALAALERQNDALARALDPAVLLPAELLGEGLVDSVLESLPAREPRRISAVAGLLAAAASFVLGAVLFGGGGKDTSSPSPGTQASQTQSSATLMLGTLSTSTGPVEMRRAGGTDFEPLRIGSTLSPGAVVRTVGASLAALALSDGSYLRLAANTSVQLIAPRRVCLDVGRVLADVQPGSQLFSLQAGSDRVEVLGTQLDLRWETDESSRGITSLTVLSGRARLGDQTVEAGFACRSIDGVVERPRRVRELALTSRWVNDLLRLEGRDSEELSRRVGEMLSTLGRTKMESLYEWEIRTLAPGCVIPLCRYLLSEESRDELFRTGRAALLVGDLAGPEHVPELLPLLEHDQKVVRTHTARALGRIRGVSLEYDDEYWAGEDVSAGVAAWRKWYDGR